MTINECKTKIEYLIEEAKHLRGTVISWDMIFSEKKIASDRLEPFFKDVKELLAEVTNNKKYIESYEKIMHPYEYYIKEIQGKLMELYDALEFVKIIKIKK